MPNNNQKLKLSERLLQIGLYLPVVGLVGLARLLWNHSFTRPLVEWVLKPRDFSFRRLASANRVVIKIPRQLFNDPGFFLPDILDPASSPITDWQDANQPKHAENEKGYHLTIQDVQTIEELVELVGTVQTGQTHFVGTDPVEPYAEALILQFYITNQLVFTFGLRPTQLFSWYDGGRWNRR